MKRTVLLSGTGEVLNFSLRTRYRLRSLGLLFALVPFPFFWTRAFVVVSFAFLAKRFLLVRAFALVACRVVVALGLCFQNGLSGGVCGFINFF